MEIKFSVGQKIFTIGKAMINGKVLWLYGEEEVESIVIDKKGTYINVRNGYYVEEKFCFTTKEEAEVECRRRNGNI